MSIRAKGSYRAFAPRVTTPKSHDLLTSPTHKKWGNPTSFPHLRDDLPRVD
ncbi:MAG: hypothetical protein WCC47_21715 [Pseudonocardiaceae bacterium]